jgi:hypothetical protein
VPGTRLRFGWDGILGLVPWAGDVATAFMACAIIVEAHRRRLPRVVQLRMLMNVALDLGLGLVPLAGDAADVFWKANTRNMALLERHLPGAGTAPAPTSGDWLFVTGVLAVIVVLAALPLLLASWVLNALGRGLF